MPSLPLCREANADSDFSKHLEKKSRAKSLALKKEQGEKPCSKNCVDPISPQNWI
jgi:hypothetical protein